MLELLESIESIFQLVVQYGVLLMECVGVVILLRGALTFLIHWEIKTEEAHLE